MTFNSFSSETIDMFWEMYEASEDREETPQEYLETMYREFIFTDTEYETLKKVI